MRTVDIAAVAMDADTGAPIVLLPRARGTPPSVADPHRRSRRGGDRLPGERRPGPPPPHRRPSRRGPRPPRRPRRHGGGDRAARRDLLRSAQPADPGRLPELRRPPVGRDRGRPASRCPCPGERSGARRGRDGTATGGRPRDDRGDGGGVPRVPGRPRPGRVRGRRHRERGTTWTTSESRGRMEAIAPTRRAHDGCRRLHRADQVLACPRRRPGAVRPLPSGLQAPRRPARRVLRSVP